MDTITQSVLDKHFCVKDIRFMSIMESKGMDTCDGILGISPKNYNRHAFLAELKIGGLIDRGIISFSNAYYKASFQQKEWARDKHSYAIFGGINETQIVGGEEGLVSMPLVQGSKNPTDFWGVRTRGFAYGKTILMDPSSDDYLLGVVDSGTTLVIVPTVVYENLIHTMAEKFKHNKGIDMVCSRDIASNKIDHCYFNNTKCSGLMEKHADDFDDLKFVFGNFEFTLKPPTLFRDSKNNVEKTGKRVPCCSLGIRHHKDDIENPKRMRFLIGNIFLKNFYSVYDYDTQEVRLGVNTHSEGMASIRPFRDGKSWTEGYQHIPKYFKTHLKKAEDDWKARETHDADNEEKSG
mmetsp:Transcript_1795/g.2348  ORF Transcript_1795/g.2348 Transcript_1795/m.2348 type:complete len:350 (+) Transcript_1795:1196-2245(+)|eukprot:CAMPEP_0170508374 /NCGR_PEP_ID=MMETSP0208-20121228/62147_1 /TAXON_ID=197538 /ORGANISM="Strombidium inclinatum, Strain S3" /LENGTH=349 /DNA_ID=CAMNT_0010791235 /DNA_START=1118 /DNA_END=2167 /DNA_ORIENTATION=+